MSFTDDQIMKRQGYADDGAADERAAAVAALCEEDPHFARVYRVSEWLIGKFMAIPLAERMDQSKHTVLRSYVHRLESWIDAEVDEMVDAMLEEAAERRDPYRYRGLSRSDFL